MFGGIEPTATDANIVAGRHRQRVHNNVGLIGVALLEGLSQQLEQYPPECGLDGVDAAVEATLAEYLLHVAVLVEEQAGLVNVGAEEGRGHKGHSLITSAVDIPTWRSSWWPMAFKKSSHKQ
ncbi:MAG: hypothetical protein M3Q29_17835 [Chloroflexota bacterium]|nr:hypothetical protein [Chloroflexota bacterium]